MLASCSIFIRFVERAFRAGADKLAILRDVVVIPVPGAFVADIVVHGTLLSADRKGNALAEDESARAILQDLALHFFSR
jgi:hypothetical protein